MAELLPALACLSVFFKWSGIGHASKCALHSKHQETRFREFDHHSLTDVILKG